MNMTFLASGVVVAVLAVGAHVVHADSVALPGTAPHVLQVDDDDEGDGDRWVPFWFGLRAFAPPQRVIVEHQYYYGPTYAPPPPPVYAPPPATYWYYCREPEGYYPQIHRCPGGWLRVVPQAGDGP